MDDESQKKSPASVILKNNDDDKQKLNEEINKQNEERIIREKRDLQNKRYRLLNFSIMDIDDVHFRLKDLNNQMHENRQKLNQMSILTMPKLWQIHLMEALASVILVMLVYRTFGQHTMFEVIPPIFSFLPLNKSTTTLMSAIFIEYLVVYLFTLLLRFTVANDGTRDRRPLLWMISLISFSLFIALVLLINFLF